MLFGPDMIGVPELVAKIDQEVNSVSINQFSLYQWKSWGKTKKKHGKKKETPQNPKASKLTYFVSNSLDLH